MMDNKAERRNTSSQMTPARKWDFVSNPNRPLQMLYRNEWTDVPPRFITPLDLPVTRIFLISTSRPSCLSLTHCTAEMQKIQNFQMLINTIPDIRYNFVITHPGAVYEGRGWKAQPNLPRMYAKYEISSLMIAFSGDFRDAKAPVPKPMLDTMERLIKLGLDYKYISPDYESVDLC